MLISSPTRAAQKDRHATAAEAEADDQLIDVSGGDRVQAAGWLVEE